MQIQLKWRAKTLWADQGHEYLLDMSKAFCEEKEIHHQLMIPHTPQHNGNAEHRNQTLLEMVKSMMAYANLLISFRGMHYSQ